MTNGEFFQDALGLIDEMYIEEIMRHRPASSVRRRVMRAASLAACLCLLIGTIAGVGIGRSHHISTALSSAEILPPVDLDQIIWGAEDDPPYLIPSEALSESADYSSVYLADFMALLTKNGWEMSGELYRALEDANRNTYLAIHVSRNYDYTAIANKFIIIIRPARECIIHIIWQYTLTL